MGWDDSFRHAAGFFLALAMLAAIRSLVYRIKAARMPKPCHHGIVGPCKACQAAAEAFRAAGEQNARRTHLGIEWEKLRRAEIKRLSQARLRSSEAYFAMEPREFEDVMMKVFRKLGYKVSQTAYVGDGGKDAIAWKNNRKYVIECKRYGIRSATGRRDLQILLAAKHDVEADGAIFVSTGRFTAPAVVYAKENEIEYYDKGSFPDLINRAYGSPEDYTLAKTICLECGKEAYLPLNNDDVISGTAIHDGSTHEVRTTISLSQLKYPDLDLDTPWCADHQIPMRRVSGYRGEFWGCPEYPQCKNTGGSATRPAEVTEAQSKARHAELLQVYNGMSESLREQWRKRIEPEMMKHLLIMNRNQDDISAYIAARYLQGR